MMKKLLKFIFTTDYFKSFLLSFYYFPFKDAIKLPILVSYRTDIQCLSGGGEMFWKDFYRHVNVWL